jgi:hypothetical protein
VSNEGLFFPGFNSLDFIENHLSLVLEILMVAASPLPAIKYRGRNPCWQDMIIVDILFRIREAIYNSIV